jgi:uncharacterized membrane protein YoaK (UPF0700 family)
VRTRLRKNPDGLYLALMLTLTFSTGVIDAVGYLGLDRVFTANMTGNVVILGMGLTGADDLPIIGPAVALFAFMLGALVAGRTLRAKKAGWMTRTTVLLVVVAVIVGGASVLAFATEGDRPEIVAHVITGLLGIGMGVQAGAARHIAVKDVTTVVVTSTLVGLAFDSRLGGKAKQQWARRLLAVVFIGGGAAVGALLLNFGLGTGMAVTAGIVMLVALVGQIGKPVPAPAEVVEDQRILKA